MASTPIAHLGVLLRKGENPTALHAVNKICAQASVQVTQLHVGDTPPRNLDAVIALGGDGTVLRALGLAGESPVLGINFGSVGFLTAGERTDLQNLLKLLFLGKWLVSERLLLEGVVPSLGMHAGREAFNEVAIHTTNRMMKVEVAVNGASIRTIRGDGVLVSTPTGSTGYLLATGGPIAMPEAQCFVLNGINEYNLTSRPLILPSNATVALRIGCLLSAQQARLQMDGEDLGFLHTGDVITLKRAARLAKLIFFKKDFFFHSLSTRLSWITPS